MKRNFFKKLAMALALTVAVTSVNVPVSAAAKPGFKSSKVAVKVGQTKKYGTQNSSKYSVKFVIGNKKIAKIKYSKGSKAVKVTGVKAGYTTLRADFKNYATKKVTKVRIPVTVKAEVTTATVSTQAQLEAALKNEKLTKIVLKTDAEAVFTIPAGEYKNVDFVVDAPNADVENEGTFKSIQIENIKPSTWKEKAKGNNIVIAAKNARVVVEKGASVGNISLTASEGKVAVEVNGKVESVVVEAKTEVALSGETGKLDVVVAETAKGAEVASSVSVNITAAVDIHVALAAGAEGSKVTVTGTETKVTVDNQSKSTVVVDTPTGNQTVNAGQNTSTGTGNTDNSGNTGSIGGGGSTGGGSVAAYEYSGYDYNAILATAIEGNDITVSGNDIYFNGTVDGTAEITISGNKLTVGGKSIATLLPQIKVTGVDGNANTTTGTAGIRWFKSQDLTAGVYRIAGELNLPAGWSNPNERGIPLVLYVTGQIADDTYAIKSINIAREFFLTKNENSPFDITTDSGKVTISSEGVLDGVKLKVVKTDTAYELRYDTEVIGTMPTEVWVVGVNPKDPDGLRGETKLQLSEWWEDVSFNSKKGSYQAVARVRGTENWLDVYGQAAIMEVVLKSNSVVINDIKVWNGEDANAYANAYPEAVSSSAIQAAVTSGGAIKAAGTPVVTEGSDGITTVKYSLAGELPSFIFFKEKPAAPYLLFSLEKSTGGRWMDSSFKPLSGDAFAFSTDGNKMIACVKMEANITEFIFCWDANGNETQDAGDVKFVVDVTDVILK